MSLAKTSGVACRPEHDAESQLREKRWAGGPNRNCEEKVRLKRLSRMPEEKTSRRLSAGDGALRLSSQRGAAPSGVKLGGAVRSIETLRKKQCEQG